MARIASPDEGEKTTIRFGKIEADGPAQGLGGREPSVRPPGHPRDGILKPIETLQIEFVGRAPSRGQQLLKSRRVVVLLG